MDTIHEIKHFRWNNAILEWKNEIAAERKNRETKYDVAMKIMRPSTLKTFKMVTGIIERF